MHYGRYFATIVYSFHKNTSYILSRDAKPSLNISTDRIQLIFLIYFSSNNPWLSPMSTSSSTPVSSTFYTAVMACYLKGTIFFRSCLKALFKIFNQSTREKTANIIKKGNDLSDVLNSLDFILKKSGKLSKLGLQILRWKSD